MVGLTLHYDFRAPEFGAPIAALYRTALEQVSWGEANGFSSVIVSSHHGCDDNYGAAPLIEATAMAARTTTIRVAPVVTLTLYHPLHVAEDVAALDLFSEGRIDLIVAAGYRPSEMAMFGRAMSQRGRLMEEGVTALRQAWTGEPFDFRGERVLVRPRPWQRPSPPIVMTGDSVAAARRAARLGDAYLPMTGSPTYQDYVVACEALGKPAPPPRRGPTWMFLHVTEDPDKAWSELAPHLLHVTNSYGTWMADAGVAASYTPIADAEGLRASGNFQVVTPEECLELAGRVDNLMFDPLFGGIRPELAWESLELAARRVFPALRTEVQDQER